MKNDVKVPTVNKQHEYIRVNLGNNRGLTVSYSGCKANGRVPDYVFDLWDKATRMEASKRDPAVLQQIGVKADANLGDVADAFAKAIPKIWPEWNVASAVPAIGATVTLNFGKRKGNDTGVVEGVRGTMVSARFAREGLVSFPADMLA